MITGADLFNARTYANVSAYGISKQMGVSRQYVAKLERADSVSVAAARRYATAIVTIAGPAGRDAADRLRAQAERTVIAQFAEAWPA
jgi:transcriptional regulator with XRE-family HTH domain